MKKAKTIAPAYPFPFGTFFKFSGLPGPVEKEKLFKGQGPPKAITHNYFVAWEMPGKFW